MSKYRKKPIVVEAEQFFRGKKMSPKFENAIDRSLEWIDTLEGPQLISDGDWIIEGTSGEFYPCKPKIFKQVYEAIE